ncbi:MAG: hypothetical protein K9N55_01045 [Phycisphaerae bacterium]|nr:hypothetical protein [Phycisphaerae bacterium]
MKINQMENNAVTLRIELCHIKPTIWRQVRVPLDYTLGDLHTVIQIAMGWQNSHLHMYKYQGELFGMIDEDSPEDLVDEYDVFLEDLFTTKGKKIQYTYDFGDDWEHIVTCQELLHTTEQLPVILKGKNACPPEDCGGEPGYCQLLEVMADPKHPEYESMREWLGGLYDPKLFDLEEANAVLQETMEQLDELYDDFEAGLDGFEDLPVYDALEAPASDQWLELDEQDRILAIEAFHDACEEELPDTKMHSIIHAIVENQLAENLLETHRTLKRLMDEGLDRHNAIHAIGSAVAQHMFELMGNTTKPKEANAKYSKMLNDLTADKWLKT